jgi:polyhydroxyalkanoate synthesis regulator phasin
MRLSRALNDKKMDLRLRDKLIHEGKLSANDVDTYLNDLPDDAANATTIGEMDNKVNTSALEQPAEEY